jgi:hypothetical protein
MAKQREETYLTALAWPPVQDRNEESTLEMRK